jgi:hypothetical protein
LTDLKYEEIYPQSRRELAEAFESGDSEQVRVALYSAAKFEPDWEWTQKQCLRFLVHEDYLVRWAAALSLGFIALYQRRLDLATDLPELHAAKADARIASAAEASLDMIQQYIKPN